MKALHTIGRNPKAFRKRRRVGRGNASGRGTYAGRGQKGQRARSGGRRGLIARSMKSYLLRIPKVRGFTSTRTPSAVVNLDILQEHFENGAQVTPQKLAEKGLIATSSRVKILGNGNLTKRLAVSAHAFSKRARQGIENASGTINILMQQRRVVERRRTGGNTANVRTIREK